MKIAQEVLDLSAKLQSQIKLNVDKAGVATPEVPATIFADSLPEDLDKAQAERVATVVLPQFAAAATHAVGTLANEAMKKNKNLKSVEVTIPLFGKDSFTVASDRMVKYPAINREGEPARPPVMKFGVITTALKTNLDNTKIGQMGAIKKLLGEEALAAFGS